MKSLRSKASRFFRDSPTPDEKVAVTDASDVDFDAGIQSAEVTRKPSRFFGRKKDKLDKPLPTPPSTSSSSSTLLASVTKPVAPCDNGNGFDDLPDYDDEDEAESSQTASTSHDSSITPEQNCTVDESKAPKIKPRSSFSALKNKSTTITDFIRFCKASLTWKLGSRLFGGMKGVDCSHSPPPPPPLPQIPVDIVAPKTRRRVLTPYSTARSSRSSLPHAQGRSISISRPQPMPQLCNLPIPENAMTVPFEKRPGPPPTRPDRPESLDEETLAFMQEAGVRMVYSSSHRVSASTATTSTTRSQTSSIEARLGFPCGFGTPRNFSIDSPLAARFVPDPSQRLPVRDSDGSLRFSRFSEYVKYKSSSVDGVDGVDAEDRELGPIEQYRAISKEADWALEKRVSREDGKQGEWDKHFKKRIGTTTERLWFGGGFKLTDQHIDDLLGLSLASPKDLEVIGFTYEDVSYAAHNATYAIGLTDAGITRLALHCPKLNKVELPGTSHLGDEANLSLLEHCPDLGYLQFTYASGNHRSTSEQWIETFRAHPEWAPSLKTLRIDRSHPLSKLLQELGKERPELTFELMRTREEKIWGDWELDVTAETFKNGKECKSRETGDSRIDPFEA
ncbi:hypothetical protein PtrSN002B_005566 [Pyrenophora tritici-repentis]|uniref:Uncharacterized protein n=1 Tax=Pyrenophora tritici-repentis TaxID=45151 RepID=A0A2W1H9Q0_9PLEO|nr:hypothetical protein Alg215_05316 [Pyrenophora tritici-repentis]KAI0591097.1 hypothetical protein Alg130_01624 [Pyrenophora tritici-repentis]KAI0614187.1 hypothetical protein TUN205_01583 [Pyrenophora tritici-repentis]KAI1520875.1 hypothetical protein Ptr86124_001243 [Pyrenophora tritici-repentis]KAI1537100.1 hypothetical protein PtrSN001A_005411 [Pyrenophora tritici-repentis]